MTITIPDWAVLPLVIACIADIFTRLLQLYVWFLEYQNGAAMSDLFLSDDELVSLTGYRQSSKQVSHLKAQRIPFHTNRSGRPRVARAALEGRRNTEPPKQKTWTPSWAANQA